GLFVEKFDVAFPYQTLEAVGAYTTLPIWADDLQVTVKDPTGKVVISYNGLDVLALVEGTGGSATSFPLGYAYDTVLGTYTLQVSGAGTNPVHIKVRGYLGADMDFNFHNAVTSAPDKVADYRGKVVLVDLMATWCGPCNKAMPGLKQIRDDYAGKVEILSIDVDNTETDSQLLAMRAKYSAEWPFGFDDQQEAQDAFGTGWIPSFGIIDQHGVLLFRHIGEMETGQLRDIIDYALEER
ncbi:MAG: TlpA family protein disulfide reductase, partial [Halobacteriales archaeon]|nr:TlpA family protein disulfide reductase [Halobacteriales archaeon]